MICNHNGRFINPDELLASGQDGAWLYGDTLFETMKASGGHIHFLRQHLDRMATSARLIDFPFDRAKITEALDASMQQAGEETSRIRLTLSRGNFASIELPPGANGHFLVQVSPAKEPSIARINVSGDCFWPETILSAHSSETSLSNILGGGRSFIFTSKESIDST